MPNTLTVVGYGAFSDFGVRFRILKSVLDNAGVSLSSYNRFFVDGKRISRPHEIATVHEFREVDFARVPKGITGTVMGQINGFMMTMNHVSLTVCEEHPAFRTLLIEEVMTDPEIIYGIGFHMPSSCKPSLFAGAMPYASEEWKQHIYYERAATTIVWSKVMSSPEILLAGKVRNIFEENLLNANQVKSITRNACGSALRRHHLEIKSSAENDSMYHLTVPLDVLPEIRKAFYADHQIP